MAQRLSTEVRVLLDRGREQASAAGFDRDASAGLSRIAETFRDAGRLLGETAPSACLAVVTRMIRAAEHAATSQSAETRVAPPGPSLIIP
jgi:hypothetical protein